jgi:hypothetical protein
MEYTAAGLPARAWALPRRLTSRIDGPGLSAWTLAFALVTYLALRDGGYDTIVRSEVGVAVWWIVLLSALAGILPTSRIGRFGWAAIGLLAGFAIWTGVAVGWSENRENTMIEFGRIAAYLGVLVLAISLQGRSTARHTVSGLASAIGLVTVLAVLSRLHPQAFPADQHFRFLGAASARKLSYPLNYWNALAAFAAIGAPLLLAVAVGARTLGARAVAAAVLPLSALCIYLTISRGGVIELGIGLVVFVLLVPRRVESLATLLVAGTAAAILIWATSQRTALTSGVATPPAIHQGTQILWLAVIVCVGVALLQVAVALAADHIARPRWLAVDRRAATRRWLVLLLIAVVAAAAAGVPSRLEHVWHDFKQPNGVVTPGSENSVFSRLSAANGNGRYQYWQAALNANATDPWRGIGPGTFEFWWAQHATTYGFVRNAHSLYFETLAETGIVGLVLLGGMLLVFVAAAVRRSFNASSGLRLWLAAAAAGLAAFLVSAAFEWVWQLAAIAATALLLGAVLVAGADDPPARARARRNAGTEPAQSARRGELLTRVILSAGAVAAIAAISLPLAGALAIRRSQADASRGDLGAALADARSAERLEPYAATPHLQEALVREAAGQLSQAASAARVATSDAPTDWTTWLTLARIDARRGAFAEALAALQRARELNPRSSLFQQS